MKKLVIIICSLLMAVMLVACNKEEASIEEKKEETSKENSNITEEQTGVEVTDALGEVKKFSKEPQTFATLSSGELSILQALEANVVGRPTINGPMTPEVEKIREIGNLHQPNFEKIAEVHPDVLVTGVSFQPHAATVERQGTTVFYTKANSIEDLQETITHFGVLTNRVAKAAEINERMTKEIQAIEKVDTVKTLLVYGAPGTYLAALPHSLSGDLLTRAGGENIASDFPKEEEYPQYASLSIEKIIERNPEVVMLITHGEPEAVKAAFEQEMNQNPAWKNLDAVKENRMVVLPAHLFGTNPGMLVTEALQVMKESLEKAGN